MEDNMGVPMSDWEWEGIINDPDRQDSIVAHYDEKELNKERFHAKYNGKRRDKILFQAAKYLTAAVGFMAVTAIAMEVSVSWLAWGAGAMAVIMALIASYGFGKAKECAKKY